METMNPDTLPLLYIEPWETSPHTYTIHNLAGEYVNTVYYELHGPKVVTFWDYEAAETAQTLTAYVRKVLANP